MSAEENSGTQVLTYVFDLRPHIQDAIERSKDKFAPGTPLAVIAEVNDEFQFVVQVQEDTGDYDEVLPPS
jgi:hypothetical protein